MKILVNGINIKVGGGITVLTNFLKAILSFSEFHNIEFYVIVPSGLNYEQYNNPPVKIEIIPEAMKSPVKRLWLDHTWLKSRIEDINPDVIFTIGHIGVPTAYKQAILFMYPYAIYPDEKVVWKKLGLITQLDYKIRNMVFKQRLGYVDIVFPQTEVAKKRLLKYYGKEIKEIKVIPTAFSKIGTTDTTYSFFDKNSENVYLLCLTKYYSHKNIEILIPVAEKIKSERKNICLITTIDKTQGAGAKKLLENISKLGLEEIIINIGKVPMEGVPSLYTQVNALLMPTLLESFSATYIDSLSFGVPVFTSDRDFARDVCGEDAWYFDPHDPQNIYDTIISAFDSPDMMKEKIENGKRRAASMPDWSQVTEMYINALKDLCEN